MKVLHLCKYYPPYWGGIEKVSFDLVESLNKLDCHVDVLCFNDKNKTIIEKGKYSIHRASIISSAFSSPLSISIFSILNKLHNKYDIIHIHLPNPMAAIALQLINYKGIIVIHWHSDIVKQRFLKKIYQPFQNKLLKRADKIIVTSNNYLSSSIDLKDFKNKCSIIPLGISKEDFISNSKFNSQLKNNFKDKFVIFSLGRLIYYKGFEFLIESARSLPDNFIILIGGTGVLKDKLQQKIDYHNLNNKVVLIGNIKYDQISEYYNIANIFCLPSIERSEAFGVVLIEAMAFGCPIVSTSIEGSGASWVNQNNITGLKVAPKDSKALSDAFIKMSNSEILMSLYSNNSIERHNKLFKKEIMVSKTLALYNNILNNS